MVSTAQSYLSQSLKPPSKLTTGLSPISIAIFAAKADLQALHNKKDRFYPD